MTATLTPTPKQQFFDTSGLPLAAGFVYTYAAGTTTPLATYVDSTGVATNPNPVLLDGAGRASIWLGASPYKFVVQDANGLTQYTTDNIQAPSTYAPGVTNFNTRTGNIVLNGTDVITALGFTPYNATNPSNYLTPSTGVSSLNTQVGSLVLSSPNNTINVGVTGGNTITIDTIGGGVNLLNGLSGNVTLMSSDLSVNITASSQHINLQSIPSSASIISGLGYTPYNETNPNAFISNITSSEVTAALGYIPYSESNPNGFVSNAVSYLNGLSGNVTLVGGAGITVTPGTGNVTISNAATSAAWGNWTAFTSTSRVLGTTYTGNANQPTLVSVTARINAPQAMTFYVNGSVIATEGTTGNDTTFNLTAIVPPGGTYKITGSSFVSWSECLMGGIVGPSGPAGSSGSGFNTITHCVVSGTGINRVLGSTYTNTTTGPMQVNISGSCAGNTNNIVNFLINGVIVHTGGSGTYNGNNAVWFSVIVPSGMTYEITCTSGGCTLEYWTEIQ